MTGYQHAAAFALGVVALFGASAAPADSGYKVVTISGIIEEVDNSQLIGEGDIVIIPAGVAHGFSEITEAITYMVVRIDPEKLVALK